MTRVTFLRAAQIAIDLVLLSAAFWLACLLRFEGEIPKQMLKRALFLWPYVVGFQYGLLFVFGVPRYSWRYVGLREAVRILGAVGVGSVVLGAARFLAYELFNHRGYAQYAYLPYGVVAIDFLLAFMGIGGIRAARRIGAEKSAGKRAGLAERRIPTLLVGAGSGGLMVAKEIAARPELGVEPLGFIDDDPLKQGTVVHGLKVLGTTPEIGAVARRARVKQAVITIPSASGGEVRRIADVCRRAGLEVKIVPGLYELVGGQLNLTPLRDVAIEDLLRRDPIELEDERIRGDLEGRAVLVTGAGGSIGSEIGRQVARFRPGRLVLVDRAENALFEAHRELSERFPELDLVPAVGDVGDAPRMRQLFQEHQIEVLFHAAAHKHVPMMEQNPGEALKNNVLATRSLADLARAAGLRAFVFISTDKAVNPTSVMGASKRAAEMYVQALGADSSTRFVTVRFGNVLGSNGSVVPIFKRQIERGGPITVTHPEMQRYFMTIPEACQLVLQAGAMGQGGEIFILDMGEPVKIVDLARDLIRLSGLEEADVRIEFTAPRPGEKLFEELSVAEENAVKTRHPKVFIGKAAPASLSEVAAGIDAIGGAVAANDASGARAALSALVPEFRGGGG